MSRDEAEAALRDLGYEAEDWPIEAHLELIRTEPLVPLLHVALCTKRYAEAGPALRAVLVAAADGARLSEEDETLLFRGLFIMSGARDELAFEPLLRLLKRPEPELSYLLGDLITESLSKIVAGTFDGNESALLDSITDRDRDEFIRDALFGAATFLTWEGRIARDSYRDFLVSFFQRRLAEDGDFAWIGWLEAITLLGMRDLVPLVDQAWEGRLPERVLDRRHFEQDLLEAERRPGHISRFHDANLGYIDDIAIELDWVRACEALAEEEPQDEGGPSWEGLIDLPDEPVTNPWRHVGRNDPCLCGSGRKAKKCCLGA